MCLVEMQETEKKRRSLDTNFYNPTETCSSDKKFVDKTQYLGAPGPLRLSVYFAPLSLRACEVCLRLKLALLAPKTLHTHSSRVLL